MRKRRKARVNGKNTVKGAWRAFESGVEPWRLCACCARARRTSRVRACVRAARGDVVVSRVRRSGGFCLRGNGRSVSRIRRDSTRLETRLEATTIAARWGHAATSRVRSHRRSQMFISLSGPICQTAENWPAIDDGRRAAARPRHGEHLHDHAVGALAHVWQIRVARPDLERLPAHHLAVRIHARGALACRHFDNYFAARCPGRVVASAEHPAIKSPRQRRATTPRQSRHWRRAELGCRALGGRGVGNVKGG